MGLIRTGHGQRFQVEYKASARRALRDDEPAALAAGRLPGELPEHSRAGEPEDLSPADFMEDRLLRLVRRAIEAEEITLSRGAEILGLSMQEMRQLSVSWVG